MPLANSRTEPSGNVTLIMFFEPYKWFLNFEMQR